MIPERLDAVTVDDLVRAGACREGVIEVRDRIAPHATQAEVAQLLAKLDDEQRNYLMQAAGLAGDGYGDGSGYGNGYGDGYGNGNGYGNGYGDGDG